MYLGESLGLEDLYLGAEVMSSLREMISKHSESDWNDILKWQHNYSELWSLYKHIIKTVMVTTKFMLLKLIQHSEMS